MGTRALVRVFDEGREILCLYKQFDGYPEGLGKNLAEFVSSKQITNGVRGDGAGTANGMGCLAGQILTHLKDGCVGSVYVYPPGSSDCGEEYEYHVRGPGRTETLGAADRATVEAFEVSHGTRLTPIVSVAAVAS